MWRRTSIGRRVCFAESKWKGKGNENSLCNIQVLWPRVGQARPHAAQQTCLLCDTADMFGVRNSRHVRCVAQQGCLPCHAADSSVARPSSHVTLLACLLCDTADTSVVQRGRRTCCAAQQTRLLQACLITHRRGVPDEQKQAILERVQTRDKAMSHRERRRAPIEGPVRRALVAIWLLLLLTTTAGCIST